jgi:hypothetical protein
MGLVDVALHCPSKLERETRKAPDRLGLGPTCQRAQLSRTRCE